MRDSKKQEDDPLVGKDFTKLRLSDDEDDLNSSNDVISPSKLSEIFEEFLRTFKDRKSEGNSGYYYMDKIAEMVTKENWNLEVNYLDLTTELFDLVFNSPKVESIFDAFHDAVKSIFLELFPTWNPSDADKINVRISVDDPKILTPVSRIDVDLRSKLIGFDCIIISTSEVKSALKDKRYRCSKCGKLYRMKLKICRNLEQTCGGVNTINFSLNDSKLTQFQYIEVQERQDDRTGNFNSLPNALNVKLYGDLVNKFRAGDNVRILGVLKLEKTSSTDSKLNKETDTVVSSVDDFSDDILFNTIIEAHNMQLLSTSQDQIIKDPSKILTKEDMKAIETFVSKYPDDTERMNILHDSFADYIYGYEDVKDTMLYIEVGSVPVSLADYNIKRAEINALLIGDPGTTKTSLIKEAAKLSIHGIYTSGKGSSGVGLTASIDNDAKGLNKLKVGAAVLADRGLCAIDEFLSINEDDREYLLECMENGTFHVNKGGINAILNTRAAFVMACNSIFGKYDRHQSLKANVPLTDQMFSRADIVYVLLDIPNTVKDDRIADHVLNLYDPSYKPKSLTEDKRKTRVPREFLFKYLVFARTHNLYGIRFTPEAIRRVKSFYQEIRLPQQESDVTATPRQLESVIRFSIARARLMLRNVVNEDDVNAIIGLLTRAFQSTGMMPQGSVSTGLNMTSIYSKPLNKMNQKSAFIAVFMNKTKGGKDPCEKEDIILELRNAAKWTLDECYHFWDEMMKKGKILTPKPSRYLYDLDSG